MRSKPKQSDDNGQVEAAVAKLKDARRFEDSKQYSTAVMLYEEACGCSSSATNLRATSRSGPSS